MREYLRNVCFIIGSLSSASYMMKDININLLTELFSGNFNGNFIELKCTTLFFEGKTKQNQKSCLSVSCCLFWWKWLSLSRILTWKKIQIPLCQEMALSDWNYKLIKKPEKVVDSKLSIENDINCNCATFHEILLNS